MDLECFIYYKKKIKGQLEKARYIKENVKKLVEIGNLDSAEIKIQKYKELFSTDVDVFSIKTIIQIIKGNLDKAENYALEGLKIIPFNFDLNYNLGYIYLLKKDYQKALDTFIIAKSTASTAEEIKTIEDSINQIKSENSNIDFMNLFNVNPKLFPLKTNEETWIGKVLFKNSNEEGYIPLYYEETLASYPIQMWNFYKTETLKAKIYDSGEFEINNLSESVLPIAIFSPNNNIIISINNKEYRFNNFMPNRYTYVPIDEGKIIIKSDNKFIVGDQLALKQKNNNSIKLVLNLFIDGLSQKIIEEYSLQELMPNTFCFFSKGKIFNNCYSNAEWTLASVPTIFTGKYLANHKIFHPELLHSINNDSKTVGEYFKESNYFTFQSCGNWRKNPAYGYVKGFDRTIYQSATRGSKTEDIIFSYLEHLRAFKERDSFSWLSFFELHNVDDNISSRFSNQILNSIDSRVEKINNKKSVHKDYDEKKIERYISEIQWIDAYMKIIYDYIENNYSNDEILISLFSDHGQSYIDKENHILRDARTRVPFMIRGRNVVPGLSHELIENVDILPTILSLSDIKFDESDFDGHVPKTFGGREKDFVYCESIYPGKTYKAIIRDLEHTIYFESEGLVESDGRFFLGNFSLILENNLTKKDEINENANKADKYFNIIISHISGYFKI